MAATGVSSKLAAATSPTVSAGAALITPKLTTTFTPAGASCTGDHFTMLANREFEIWLNEPVPVPGTTITDCYPDVFLQSFLSSAGGITQPAFQPLVCPESYRAVGPYTSNYIACCPSGYGFAGPKETPFTDRPAFGGTCYTNIEKATPIIVTQYGSSGVTATTTFSATDNSAQAYAYPYEGTAFGVAQLASITPGASSGAVAPANAIPTGNTKGTGMTHTVLAAAGPTFIPDSVIANVGDSVLFEFTSGNHTVTQSTFDSPCSTLAEGFDSGYTGNSATQSVVSVNTSTAQFFYSKQGSDCREGMVFALNPSTAQSAAAFHAAAIAEPSPSKPTTLSVGAKVGIAIASVAGVGIVCLIAFFFLRKRRQALAAEAERTRRVSEYSNSDQNSEFKHVVTPVVTESLSRGPQSVSFSAAPVSPPASEELHAESTPTELATYNQNAAVELQGVAIAEKDSHTNRYSFSPPAHIPELLSPLMGSDNGGDQNRHWPNEKNSGIATGQSTGHTEDMMYSAQQPSPGLPPYDSGTHR